MCQIMVNSPRSRPRITLSRAVRGPWPREDDPYHRTEFFHELLLGDPSAWVRFEDHFCRVLEATLQKYFPFDLPHSHQFYATEAVSRWRRKFERGNVSLCDNYRKDLVFFARKEIDRDFKGLQRQTPKRGHFQRFAHHRFHDVSEVVAAILTGFDRADRRRWMSGFRFLQYLFFSSKERQRAWTVSPERSYSKSRDLKTRALEILMRKGIGPSDLRL